MTEKTYFTGKIALITGGSSGIGLALAKQLAAQGARVWITGRRKDVLTAAGTEVQSATGRTCSLFPADVSDASQAARLVEEVIRRDGLPDLVINSAGVTQPGYVQDLGLDVFRQMMDINYFGTVNVVKAILPGMIGRGSGHIVNISSAAGFVTGPGYAAYSPSKFAVRGFSDVLRAEMKPHGIRVSVVFPPDTDTPQLAYEKQNKTPELQQLSDDASIGPFHFGLLSPEQVAKAILNGVQHGSYIILPGKANYVLYHLVRLLGNLVFSMVDDQWSQARRKHRKV
ncbi:MAG: SDR family oxidoreductase [Chloroflexota bacterium]